MNGAALVGRILAELASAPPCKAAELSARLGAGRTATFAALSALESAGLVDRDASGVVSPGPLASRLGYAAFGLAPLSGAVEALLPALRDDANARADFVVDGRTLARRHPAGDDATGATVEAQLPGEPRALVRLRLPRAAGEDDRAAAAHSSQAIADALSRQLQRAPAGDCD